MDATILYDTAIGAVRAVKLDLGGFHAVFTCNVILGHCTVRIEPAMPMAPDIAWAGDALAMTYHHMTITPAEIPLFEDAYAKAKSFCERAGPYIRDVMSKIERGDALEV